MKMSYQQRKIKKKPRAQKTNPNLFASTRLQQPTFILKTQHERVCSYTNLRFPWLSGLYAAPQVRRPGADGLALPAHVFSQVCALGISVLSATTIHSTSQAVQDCGSNLNSDEQGGQCTFNLTFRRYSSITFASTQLFLSLWTFIFGAIFFLARIQGFSDSDFDAVDALQHNVDVAAGVDVGTREKKAGPSSTHSCTRRLLDRQA